MDGGLLTADLGIRTGWSLLTQDGDFSCGVLELSVKRGSNTGMRLRVLRAFVKEKLEAGLVKLIVYEQTLTRHKSSAQANLSAQLAGVLLEEASIYGCDVMAVPNGTLKKHATGSGNAKKPQMIRAAWERWPNDRKRWVYVAANPSHVKVGKTTDPKLVADLKVATRRGLVPDDNQVDAVWLANYAVTELRLRPGKPADPPARGTELNEDVFTGEPIPCARCGGEIRKTSVYCLWGNYPQDPSKWVYKHPGCLNDEDGKARKVKKGTRKKKSKLKVHKGGRAKKVRTRKAGKAPHAWGFVQQIEMFQ